MVFVEVGSFLGGSLCYMGQRLNEENKKVKLYAVDTWDFDNISIGHMQLVDKTNSHFENFIKNIDDCGVAAIPIMSDSIEAAGRCEDKSIDFLFLDGNHGYPYVKNEIQAWLPKMKANSIISGHDYCSVSEIRQTVRDIFGDNFKTVTNDNSYYVFLGDGL